jgi:choice-of-anchor A domain-containing protein/fimbrial isopeptide formation D2 family protein
MSPSTRPYIHGRRPARLGSALLAVAVPLTAGVLVTLPAAMAASHPGPLAQSPGHPQVRTSFGNPVAGDQGFLVFVNGNATVSSNENEGTMALGGNLTIGGNYNVANHPPTHAFTAPGETTPVGLLIGGDINWAGSSGQLKALSNTYIKLGDAAGTSVLGAAPTQLVPTGAGAGSTPSLALSTTQSATSIEQSGLIDFNAAFTAYDQRSTAMAGCPNNVTMTNANGNTLTSPLPAGSQVYLNLSSTGTNVWTVNAADLANVSVLTLRGTPSASAPLLVNVVGTNGTFTWSPPSGPNTSQAPYVLWNFPDATTVNLAGANTVEGTIYAPRAFLNHTGAGNTEGNVIANSYAQSSAEVHDFPFAGDINCGPSASASASSSSASASASPTETSASPSPSQTTSASASPSPSPTQTSASPAATPGQLTITKSSNPASGRVKSGDVVTYTITVHNPGAADYNGATLNDNLSGVLDLATLTSTPTATLGTITLAGQSLTWSGDLPAGASATITYQVTVN